MIMAPTRAVRACAGADMRIVLLTEPPAHAHTHAHAHASFISLRHPPGGSPVHGHGYY
jgi:hypothetical protein